MNPIAPDQRQPKQPTDAVAGTKIARYDAAGVYVRGRSLVDDLIGQLDFTSMFIFHITGRVPEAPERRLVDAVLVTLMEHGLTPSTISARLVYLSPPEALQAAVAAGVLAAGSVFLGAMEDAGAILQDGVRRAESGDESEADYCARVLSEYIAAGQPVPGFGHHIHRPDDPRTPKLLALAEEEGVAGRHVALLATLAATMDELKGRHVTVNATGAIAAVLSDLGYPAQIMRGFSIVARAAGVVGHLLEEQSEPLAREIWGLVGREVPYTGAMSSPPINGGA
jgi:citrate synthase